MSRVFCVAPPDRAARELAWIWAGSALGTLLLVPFLRVLVAGSSLPSCLFRSATGWPCLGCGAGRALAALLEGDVGAAVRFHPLLTLALAGFFVGGVVAPLWTVAGLPVPRPRPSTAWRALAIAVILVQWIYACVFV